MGLHPDLPGAALYVQDAVESPLLGAPMAGSGPSGALTLLPPGASVVNVGDAVTHPRVSPISAGGLNLNVTTEKGLA